tara:strand:+ start:8362 stop:10662 length:2301 start_codon:yes stop_codon:yes gene_type:complete
MDGNKYTNLIEYWFLDQIINHTWRSIILSLLATILLGSGAKYLIIDDDMMKMIPKELESKLAWDAIQDEFGNTEIILLAFGNNDTTAFSAKTLGHLWELTDGLRNLSTVDNVINVSTIGSIDDLDGLLEFESIQDSKIVNNEDLKRIQVYLKKNPKIKKQLVSDKNDFLLTIVQPGDNIGLDLFRNEIVSVADSILKDYKIYYAGTAYITGSIPGLIKTDIISLLKAGLIIMMIVLLINLRSIAAVSLVLVLISLSLASMIGFMGWAYKISGHNYFLFALVNTSMPIILLTIANSDGVHVITKFFRELRKTKDKTDAIENTMGSLLTPIFLTSITSIGAFLTLAFSPLDSLVGYGICLSVGIGWAWFLSSLLLPSLIIVLKWDNKSYAIERPSIFENMIYVFSKVVMQFPKRISLIGFIIIFLGFRGLHKINVDVNLKTFFKPGTEIRDSMDFMDSQMLGTMDLRVRVEGDIREPSVLAAMDSLQLHIGKYEKVGVIYSIVDLVKQLHRNFMGDDLDYENIPREKEKVNNLFTMYSLSGGLDDLSKMVDQDYKTGLITAYTPTLSTKEVFHISENILNYADKHVTEKFKINVTGMIIVIRDIVFLVIKSSIFSIIFSLAIIFIISSIFFKGLIWGLMSALPLFTAIMLNFGLMGYFGVSLNHITAILSSIIIGVGVDFSIHYIVQFRRLPIDLENKTKTKNVLEEVGYPIILDAGSNMGFGALLISTFTPVQYVGGLMIFAMVSTSFGALFILSSLTMLINKRLLY